MSIFTSSMSPAPGGTALRANMQADALGGIPMGGYDEFSLLNRLRQQKQAAPIQMGGADLGGQNMQALRNQAEMAQLKAIIEPPPRRWVSGFNEPAHLAMAPPEMMTGAQRQMFLPQSASFQGASLAELPILGSQARMGQLAVRGAEAGIGSGGMTPEEQAALARRMYPPTQQQQGR